ncbi:MAG: hypothetical protein ACYCQJ_09490 [Nitrososphaerales archaeon]
MPLLDSDIAEIERISRKKSVQKISHSVVSSLDEETLSTMISSYLVLKAHGHPDSDLMTFFVRNKTSKALKLGVKAGIATLPSLLTDNELRSLIMNTRKQMNKSKRSSAGKRRKIAGRERPRIMFHPKLESQAPA